MNFGRWVQEVLGHLASYHGWDNPYEALSPAVDPDGAWLDWLHTIYHRSIKRTRYNPISPEEAAKRLNMERFPDEGGEG